MARRRPRNATVTRKGEKRSKLERALAAQLTESGVSFEHEPFDIEYIPSKPRRYKPDFVLPNGIVIEAKGYFVSEDRTKMLAVRQCNPTLDIRFVFGNAEATIAKKSTTTYGMWCDSKGFLWADDGAIPTAWLNEPPNEASLAACAVLRDRKAGRKK